MILRKRVISASTKTLNSFKKVLPSFIGIFVLLGLILQVDKGMVSNFFSGHPIVDSFLGSAIGSIAAGNPITSYIIGGELLQNGISVIAVTAFLISWVTVGVIQFPAEAIMLGKKFAFYRNVISFFLAILIALAMFYTLEAIR